MKETGLNHIIEMLCIWVNVRNSITVFHGEAFLNYTHHS
jgi:hypothetical protein